jgi:hypothetical protein
MLGKLKACSTGLASYRPDMWDMLLACLPSRLACVGLIQHLLGLGALPLQRIGQSPRHLIALVANA